MRITKKDEFKAAIVAQLMIIYSSDTSNFMLRYLRKHYRKEIRENERYEHPLEIEISFLIGLIFCFSLFILCYKGFSILNILIACFIIFICILLLITYHFYARNKIIRFWYYELLYKRLKQRLGKNKSFKGEEFHKLVVNETIEILEIL